MKRNLKSTLAMLSILLFSSLLISSFTVTPSKAVDYTQVGVKVGDWAYYSYTTNSTGGLVIPTGTTNMNMTITNIFRSNISASSIYYYSNGMISTRIGLQGNISSGQYNSTPPLAWFLGVPYLAKGDPVYVGAPYKINATGTKVSAGMARTYAYINITVSTGMQYFYFDEMTGICDLSCVVYPSGGHHAYSMWALNSTSLWSPPSYEVGVKVGDWARYSFHDNATGMTGFTYANLTITKVDRGNVTASFVWYNSTTQNVVTLWGNVSSGQGSSFPFPFVLIAANLTNADPIWLNNNFAWINKTSTAIVGGVERALVTINTTATSFPGYIYWDQLTGIAVDLNITLEGTQISWNLISTWLSPDYTKIGVKVGDWGYYSVRQESNGVDTGLRNSNLTVLSIDHGNVTFAAKNFYANGTTSTMTFWGNVSSGVGTFGRFFIFYLTAANLVNGDQVSPPVPGWINGTFSKTIFGESRVCNYFNATDIGVYLTWDQATGITTSANITNFGGLGSYLRWNMTSTSLWSPAPTINQPSAISYTFGSTGHSITWSPSSNVPSDYMITRNGTTVASGNWNGSSIICNVDGLAVGSYVYVCTVNDTISRSASSTVMVTVTAALAPGLPISVILVVGGIAVVVIVVVAVVMLRRRRT